MKWEITDQDLKDCDRDKELMIVQAMVQIFMSLCTKDGEFKADLFHTLVFDMVNSLPFGVARNNIFTDDFFRGLEDVKQQG